MYSCLFNSSNMSLQPGLFFTCYNDYMNDNVLFFRTAAPIATSEIVAGKSIYGATSNIPDLSVGTNGCIRNASPPNDFSIQWLGYFKPNRTTNWYFRTTSDACSFLWVDTYATTGFTIDNATVDNRGLHSNKTKTSLAISLTKDVYYPLRIQYGEAGGDNAMKVEFSSTSNASGFVSDGTGLYFHT
jgi:hypothetical protein